ncbi:hypothetical protein QBC44DRAFT_144035 [Cladorrhinum sp. PSN332]|nr:hypothetical protein QBC44DRAFT_144035 [Cladorrhinum sp. PSN332]
MHFLVGADIFKSMPAQRASNDKWEIALSRLSREDAKKLDFATTHAKSQDLLTEVLAAANKKKDEAIRKRWKVEVKGRTIILRHVLENIAVWVSRLMRIGDTIVQYDPASSALPWAAVRLILQAVVNDVEVFGFVVQSLEHIASVIGYCNIFEVTYLEKQQRPWTRGCHEMNESVLLLYTSILQYLSIVIHRFSQNSIIRFLKGIGSPVADLEAKFLPISVAREEMLTWSQLAEAEKSEAIQETLDRLEDKAMANFASLATALRELGEPITRAGVQWADIQDNLDQNKRERILTSISTVPCFRHHKNASNDRLKGSGRWLLERLEYKTWRHDSSSSVLWLHGIPGSGKTKLASLVIDELMGSDTLAYFYCMRNPAEPERGRGDQILASLVRQLAGSSPDQPILPPVVARFKEIRSQGAEFEDLAWTSEESSSMLVRLLAEYPTVTLVIDALDEVGQENRQQLLDALNALMLSSATRLKVFISSRDNYDIALHFEGSPNIYINADDNAGDISAFIDDSIEKARFLHGRASHKLKRLIANTLQERARGMFRWVDLQIQSLRPLKLAADIEARLGVLPTTLEASYLDIYQDILRSGDHAAKLATFTFQWLMYAQTPLTITAFAAMASCALGSSEQKTEQFTPVDVINVCSNLIVSHGDNDPFYFSHLSVQEFFQCLSKRNVDCFTPENGHSALARCCLRYMSYTDELTRPVSRCGPLRKRQKSRPYDERNWHFYCAFYSTQFWVEHVNMSRDLRKEPELAGAIKSLLLLGDSSPSISAHLSLHCRRRERKRLNLADNARIFLPAHNYAFGGVSNLPLTPFSKVPTGFTQPLDSIWLACLENWPEMVESLLSTEFSKWNMDKPQMVGALLVKGAAFGCQNTVKMMLERDDHGGLAAEIAAYQHAVRNCQVGAKLALYAHNDQLRRLVRKAERRRGAAVAGRLNRGERFSSVFKLCVYLVLLLSDIAVIPLVMLQ